MLFRTIGWMSNKTITLFDILVSERKYLMQMNSWNFEECKEGKEKCRQYKLFQVTESKPCIDSAGQSDYFP